MQTITLKFKFTLLGTMTLTSFTVDDQHLDRAALLKLRKGDTIAGDLTLRPATNEVYVEIEGEGTQTNVKGTFNFTIDDKNVFKEDQDLPVNDKGRISYVGEGVKLPMGGAKS